MKRLRFRKREVPTKLWKRVIAYFIDVFVIIILTLPIQNYLNKIAPADSFYKTQMLIVQNSTLFRNIFLSLICTMIIIVLYWSVLEWKIGQSLGKYIMHIYVKTTIKKSKLKYWQCFIRNLSKISSLLLVLDCIFFIWSKNQRFLERLSKTIVVEKREVVLL